MAAPIIFNGAVAKLLTSGLKIPGSTSGSLTLSPSATTTTYSLVFPPAQGAALSFLQNDGSGNLSFVADPIQVNNFIGLNSSWVVATPSDANAETSVGNWVNYVSGTTIPTILTGGSPSGNVTLSRTTTAGEVLNGSASLKIVKGAFNVQGEGVSVPFQVPKGYQGSQATITMALKVISGTIIAGDIQLFVYDSTNSVIIVPYNNDLISYSGGIIATFPLPSNIVSGRIGIHFASTSATAVTLSYDDVAIKPAAAAYGLAGSSSVIDSRFTYSAGFGTAVSSITTRRVGDRFIGSGYFTAGTTAASQAQLILPSGYSIDTTKIGASANATQVGTWIEESTATANVYSGGISGAIFIDPSNPTKLFFASTMASNSFVALNANGMANSNERVAVSFDVPIAGWDANVSMGASSTFKISSFLANGTRVTGAAPRNLGEYRSYLRNGASTNNLTETNAAPATVPTVADGFRIYGIAFNSGGTTGNPGRYEVFVGKNKNVRFDFYSGAGKTGYVGTDFASGTVSTSLYGMVKSYDPTTGIAVVDAIGSLGSDTTRYVGLALGAGTNTPASQPDCYVEITVSENALQVGIQAPRSEIRCIVGNNYGSVSTATRRWNTPTSTTGTAITYSDSATLGTKFLINEDGVYSVSYSDRGSTAMRIGIAVNCTQGSTAVQSTTDGSIRAQAHSDAANVSTNCSWTGFLRAGDNVTVMTDTTTTAEATNYNLFSIVKVSN